MDEFIVFDTARRMYVADITFVGDDVDYCHSAASARVFRGVYWRAFWTRPGITLIPF
jgi:hypothetical protein